MKFLFTMLILILAIAGFAVLGYAASKEGTSQLTLPGFLQFTNQVREKVSEPIRFGEIASPSAEAVNEE